MELNSSNVQCSVDLLIFCSYSSTEAEKKNGTEQFQCCSGFCVDLLAKENNESLKKYQKKIWNENIILLKTTELNWYQNSNSF